MKILIYIIFLGLFINFVNAEALELCQDTPELIDTISENCAMVTPVLTQCTNYSYEIYNSTGNFIKTDTLTKLNENQSIYYFNVTLDEGHYIFKLCDGAIREVIVKRDPNNIYYLYVVAVILLLFLVGLGYYIKDIVPVTLGGMLAIMIGMEIYLNGFPGLTNQFLKEGISFTIIGIGFLFSIVPNVEYLEELF